MKTAEEYIRETLHSTAVTPDQFDGSLEMVSDLMKDYAKQVAEQALKDAAEKATVELVWEWDGENEYQTNGGVDKDSILSTPIVTP